MQKFHRWTNRVFRPGNKNANGDQLFDFLAKQKLLTANTFFKHKACQITTWEGYLRGKKVFNQIDYIILQTKRKHSMIEARSYQTFSVDTDDGLVITKMRMNPDWERRANQLIGRKTQS